MTLRGRALAEGGESECGCGEAWHEKASKQAISREGVRAVIYSKRVGAGRARCLSIEKTYLY